MQLADFYPPVDELIRREVKVLDFLRNDPYIKERHDQFAADAATYFGRNKSATTGFEFFSYFDVSHLPKNSQERKKPNLRLIVAARIEKDGRHYSDVTYCLSVCRFRGLSILRKFHFDVAADREGQFRQQQHPRCHIQYCGTMIPKMIDMGLRETQLNAMNPWLSEPRIFSFPTSLALLVDMTLHEFPEPKSDKFRASPEWRAIIRDHETLVLKPFVDKCLAVLNDRNGSRNTLADAFYVK
jgi:hypothetical protein